jgi:flavorubredoxin
MVRSHHVSFGGDELIFICKERSSFHSYQKLSVLLFSATAFGFYFCLDLRSDLHIFVYRGVFLPLIFIGFY